LPFNQQSSWLHFFYLFCINSFTKNSYLELVNMDIWLTLIIGGVLICALVVVAIVFDNFINGVATKKNPTE